ncbi:MAG: ATP-dependent DNA helicase RecQ [Planctomycetes bacterium]|nr:ATP-dependent DNA helicase RecQ [Planctomycetota bacterium]MCC7168931.1 ATP-dependent DNA helicase RecQ [Planctomycetota bacterium]
MQPSESPALDRVLTERFGLPSFRAGQEEMIRGVLAGQDVLAVMPTGSGKSLGYALPALVFSGPVLVVSPLIALMKDQCDRLRARSIPAAFVNSTQTPDEQIRRLMAFRAGQLRLLFVAPERFKSPRFMKVLEGFKPALFAVDEAHCISEWGHDFRPDYLRLAAAARALGRPPILALTATATAEVRAQIEANLDLRHPLVLVRGFERENLEFVVERAERKDDKLVRALEELRAAGTGIVYAATRKSTVETAAWLAARGLKTGCYHAGMSDTERRSVHERFASGALPIVVATNAFGMGIDRADLRAVVHLDLPGSIEAYTQEAGRAGRDGAPARCALLYHPSDASLQRFFIETAYPSAEVIDAVKAGFVAAGRQATLVDTQHAARVPPDTHPRSIDSALRILEENGVIARGLEGDLRVARLLEDKSIDHALTQERARRERLRLDQMLGYAERARCLRAYLVEHFAGPGTHGPCGHCGACQRQGARRPLTGREADHVRAALSLVRTFDARYGRRRLIDTLLGSRSRGVLDGGLDRAREYGALRALGARGVELLFVELIALDLLCIEGGEYPLVALTEFGREVLESRAALPDADLGGSRGAPAASHRERLHAATTTIASGGPEVPTTPRPAIETVPSTPEHAALRERLREWRWQQAQAEEQPAFVVFSNRVLDALVIARPSTRAELGAISGVGPHKLEKYGDQLLAILNAR